MRRAAIGGDGRRQFHALLFRVDPRALGAEEAASLGLSLASAMPLFMSGDWEETSDPRRPDLIAPQLPRNASMRPAIHRDRRAHA